MAGILLQTALPATPLWWCVVTCVLLFLCLFPLLKKGGSSSLLFSVQFSLVCLALGYTLATAREPGKTQDFYSHYWQQGAKMEVRLMEVPHQTARSMKGVGEVLRVQDAEGWKNTSGKIMLFFAKDDKSRQLIVGDHLLVSAPLQLPSAQDNPYQFNYRRYLHRKGILFQSYLYNSNYLVMKHDESGFKVKLAVWRCHLLEVMRQAHLSSGQKGVAEALLLGWKDDVDEETYAHFQDAGITHLLCVSGLHVGIIAVLLGFCFSWLAYCRRGYLYKGLFQLAGIWLFVMLTGMAPSTLRAGIMFSCIILGELFFTKPPTLNSIATSALLLLMINPSLLFDVGCQLSYAAVIGIVTLCPPLKMLTSTARFQDHGLLWLLGKAYDLLCVTTVAQLSTLPFVLYYFHQFPTYFFIANMTVVPFATILLASVLAMMLVAWWPLAFNAMAWIVGAELEGVEACTTWVSGLPHAMLNHIYFDVYMAVLLGMAVLFFGLWLTWPRRLQRGTKVAKMKNRQNEEKSFGMWLHRCGWISLSFLLLVGIDALVNTCRHQNQRVITCYSAGRHTVLEMMRGRRSMFLCDSLTLARPEVVDYQVENNEVYHQIKSRELQPLQQYVGFENLRMMLVTRSNSYELLCESRYLDSLPDPLPLHYIIMTENAFVGVDDLCRLYRFDSVIITADNSAYRREKMKQQCRAAGVPFYDIAEQGAWQRRMRP
jgi:competence protein ComEC